MKMILVQLDDDEPISCAGAETVPADTISNDGIEYTHQNGVSAPRTYSGDGILRMFFLSGGVRQYLVKLPPRVTTSDSGELVYVFRSRPKRWGEVWPEGGDWP